MLPLDKLQSLENELNEMQEQISDPALINDTKKYRDCLRRFKELKEIDSAWKHYRKLEKHMEEVKELEKSENDPEMLNLIKDEENSLQNQLEQAELKLRDLLIPSDPNDSKNAIVEIRAGTGGEEADLFTASLIRMNSHYAAMQALKVDHQFLLEGDVFNKELIESHINLKLKENDAVSARPHPYEMMLYYNL